MKRTSILVLLTLTLSVAADAATGRYLIALKHGARPRRVETLSNLRRFESVDLVAADLTDDDVAALRQSGDVRYVSAVVPRSIAKSGASAPVALQNPLETRQTVPWGIDKVRARDVWQYSRGEGVNVAVLDTGIDRTHPDIGPNVAGAYDVFANKGDVIDDNGHGTHVAGTIAALDNGIGVVGVAPRARLWAVKVLNAAGDGSDETVIAGVDKVLEWKGTLGGNWIVSLSLGSADPSTPEEEAFKRLADAGVLAVAAAGNRGLPRLDYPGAYPTVLAVGAIDADEKTPNFSSWGTNLSVLAPGVRVLSSYAVGASLTAAASFDSGDWMNGYLVTGGAQREVTGTLVNCGYGSPAEIPPEVRGQIALMQRGQLYFAEKVRNAVAGGAIGAVIYNSDPSDPRDWTLIRQDCSVPVQCVPWSEDVNFNWPVVIALRQEDGLAMLGRSGRQVTVGVWPAEYKQLNGTSMATPHVSGIAALLWKLAPAATPEMLRSAINASAHDLGDRGYDALYGYGLADAFAAARVLAPQVVIVPPKHRSGGH